MSLNDRMFLTAYFGCIIITIAAVWAIGRLSELFLEPRTEAWVWRWIVGIVLGSSFGGWVLKRPSG